MERVIPEKHARKLDTRAPLPVDPQSPIAIKRDVHQFVVDTDPETFASAFRAVVTDPKRMFGLIRVKRPEIRLGQPFEEGERFQGCFSLEHALLGWAQKGWRRAFRPLVSALVRRRAFAWLLARVEDAMLSDYAEIEEIRMQPDVAKGEVHTLRYRYLDGTPIAGSSTFLIEPRGDAQSTVQQIFEYQEINGIALSTFQRFGLKYHDQVVHMQIHRAAAHAGARVLSGTIPDAYAALSGEVTLEPGPAGLR